MKTRAGESPRRFVTPAKAVVRFSLLALFFFSLATPSSAARITYVENDCTGVSEVCQELGYLVPMPFPSQTAIAGFRRYDELIAGLQNLGLSSGLMSARVLGETVYDRDIWAFRLGDTDSLTAEGLQEGAFLQNGTIHAREWAAPEVVAALAERLLDPANRQDQGLHQYLIENVNISLIPVLNVDGFLQTQRFPNQAQQSTFTADGNGPRDGRMRRKNMRCDDVNCENGRVDEILATLDDFLFGVDPNRNNLPGFNSAFQNSDDPRSLIFHGPGPASEREIQAMQLAAIEAPGARLRMFVDTHSFTRSYLAANTSNARRNAIQQSLAAAMRLVTANRYGYGASAAGQEIGSTDEFFSAAPYQVPAYTLEIEPRPQGAVDYGFGGVIGDGFVLPQAEIERVREELTDAHILGIYRQVAGPPSIRAVEIQSVSGNTVVFAGQWQIASGARQFVVTTRQPLAAQTDYRLWIAFNKPMRVRDGGGVVQYQGQNVALAPALALEGIAADNSSFSATIAGTASGWLANAGSAPNNGYLRYENDAYAVNFRLPASTPLPGVKRLTLAVTAPDFSNQNLDANPATLADWSNGAWAGYEDSNGVAGDIGGTDRSIRIVDDGSPPPPGGGGGGGGGALEFALLALLLGGAMARPMMGRVRRHL